MEKLEVVSFIPVRGGSKRVPRKNIKMLAGKPMMNWTIEASLKSKYVDRTFVSTEDLEMKDIALKEGAEVIDRPARFAEEKNGKELAGAMHQFFQYCWDMNYFPDILIWLYATAPLRTARHIDEAYELYMKSKGSFLCSVALFPGAMRKLRYIDEKTGLLRTPFNCRKFVKIEKYPKLYKNNGAIYIGPFGFDVSSFACDADYIIPYVMSEEDSMDVDNLFEFDAAGATLKRRMAEIL